MTKLRSVAYVCDPEDSDEANPSLVHVFCIVWHKKQLGMDLAPGGGRAVVAVAAWAAVVALAAGSFVTRYSFRSSQQCLHCSWLHPFFQLVSLCHGPGSCYSCGCTPRQLSLLSEVIAK